HEGVGGVEQRPEFGEVGLRGERDPGEVGMGFQMRGEMRERGRGVAGRAVQRGVEQQDARTPAVGPGGRGDDGRGLYLIFNYVRRRREGAWREREPAFAHGDQSGDEGEQEDADDEVAGLAAGGAVQDEQDADDERGDLHEHEQATEHVAARSEGGVPEHGFVERVASFGHGSEAGAVSGFRGSAWIPGRSRFYNDRVAVWRDDRGWHGSIAFWSWKLPLLCGSAKGVPLRGGVVVGEGFVGAFGKIGPGGFGGLGGERGGEAGGEGGVKGVPIERADGGAVDGALAEESVLGAFLRGAG